MFWFLTLVLLIIAMLFVLIPLWRYLQISGSESPEIRTRANLKIFEDRRAELEAELASGAMDQHNFEELLLELERTLLVDTDKGTGSKAKLGRIDGNTTNGLSITSKTVPIALVILLPVVAYIFYDQSGFHSDVELMDFYERTVANADNPEEATDLIIELGRVVQDDTENAWAWYFLGRNFSVIGQFEEAAIAYEQSSRRMEDNPDKAAVLGQYAQIKYITSGGELTDEVKAIINQARAINPSDTASLQLLSLDAELREDYRAAIGYWRLLIQANPNSALAGTLRDSIASAQQLLAQQENTGEENSGPVIEVNIALAEDLQFPDDMRVFVTARNAEREGTPPLAATELRVGDLPATVNLDNTMALTNFNLSSASTIFVTATVSSSGTANVQSGDYRVVSENFAHNGEHSVIDLVIRESVP